MLLRHELNGLRQDDVIVNDNGDRWICKGPANGLGIRRQIERASDHLSVVIYWCATSGQVRAEHPYNTLSLLGTGTRIALPGELKSP